MRSRRLLTNGTLLLVIALLGGLVILSSSLAVTAAPSHAPAAQIPNGAPMPALTEVACSFDGSIRSCDIWALTGSLSMPDATLVDIWGFATDIAGPATVPGPVIRANVGEILQITLHNEIPGQSVSLGFPGQEGWIPDTVGAATSATATYEFTVSQAGTFLYEAGLTENGARQLTMGLAGPLIVEDPLATPPDQEIVLLFNSVDPNFNADPMNYPMNEFHPSYWLINGRAYPDTGWIDVGVDSTVLLRYLNGGAEEQSVGLLGLSQTIVAADGQPLPFAQGALAKAVAPGQTADAQVYVPADANLGTLYPLYNASLHQHNNDVRLADGRVALAGQLLFLHVSDGGPTSALGPVPSNVAIAPPKTAGLGGVTLSATLTDDDGDVTGCEYFVNNGGPAGTGTACTVSAPAQVVTVDVIFPEPDVLSWPSGENTLYIRGQDQFDNWGALGSATMRLDNEGPEVYGLVLHPDPDNGSRDVRLTATGDERFTGNSILTAAEYRIDGGAWTAMSLNLAGSTFAELSATISAGTIGALGEGEHTIESQAMDDLGNWTAVPGSTIMHLDTTGPNVTTVALSPTQIDFSQPLTITSVKLIALVEDALSAGVQSPVANAEGFIDTVGAPGTGFPLFPSDGLFDGASEYVYFNIPIGHFRTLSPGVHSVYVVGWDNAGNWGTANSADITIVGALLRGE